MATETLNPRSDNFPQELREYQAETERQLRELRKRQEEELRESKKETERMRQETDRMRQETERMRQETDRQMQELDKRIQATTENVNGGKVEMADVWKVIKATTENVNGIAKSNGMFAEEYFFNALAAKQTFGGIHFDTVERNRERIRRLPDGQRLQCEFDVQLLNAKSVALISLKYRVRKSDVDDMVNRQVANFRQVFSEYGNCKVYLGLGGMSFGKGVIDEAKKLGIGLLRQKGEIVEYVNDEVKPY
ncbi:hypothetical protein FACS1894139_05270 [Planctomycetales bacterium]|nr:hypothetical protein FACS1894139_05270 [Planctomycetales bacterium]